MSGSEPPVPPFPSNVCRERARTATGRLIRNIKRQSISATHLFFRGDSLSSGDCSAKRGVTFVHRCLNCLIVAAQNGRRVWGRGTEGRDDVFSAPRQCIRRSGYDPCVIWGRSPRVENYSITLSLIKSPFSNNVHLRTGMNSGVQGAASQMRETLPRPCLEFENLRE
jgi:hypothetical protein